MENIGFADLKDEEKQAHTRAFFCEFFNVFLVLTFP
jgi:hypothetical protein